MLRNYSFRNAFKERMCQIHDAFSYPIHHPYTAIQQHAYDSTAEYILDTCPKAIACRSPKKLMSIALNRITIKGEFLEFGVWKGASIKYIAKQYPDLTIHGFDSFEGLPESWVHNDIGTFTLDGNIPKVPKNVTLHKGWFEETLPRWAERNKNEIAFLHVDCDLYSATKTIFDHLSKFIVPNTIILFDDYFNFPGWQDDGHAVFVEYLKSSGRSVEYLGYSFKELAVIIK